MDGGGVCETSRDEERLREGGGEGEREKGRGRARTATRDTFFERERLLTINHPGPHQPQGEDGALWWPQGASHEAEVHGNDVHY